MRFNCWWWVRCNREGRQSLGESLICGEDSLPQSLLHMSMEIDLASQERILGDLGWGNVCAEWRGKVLCIIGEEIDTEAGVAFARQGSNQGRPPRMPSDLGPNYLLLWEFHLQFTWLLHLHYDYQYYLYYTQQTDHNPHTHVYTRNTLPTPQMQGKDQMGENVACAGWCWASWHTKDRWKYAEMSTLTTQHHKYCNTGR